MRLAAILTAVALAASASAASAQELLPGVRAGASLEEIQRAYPNGAPPSEPDGMDRGRLVWEARGEAYGHPAKLRFFSRPEGLWVVQIQDDRLADGAPTANVAMVRGMLERFGAERGGGQPVCKETTNGGLHQLDCDLLAGGVRFGAYYADYNGHNAQLRATLRPSQP